MTGATWAVSGGSLVFWLLFVNNMFPLFLYSCSCVVCDKDEGVSDGEEGSDGDGGVDDGECDNER